MAKGNQRQKQKQNTWSLLFLNKQFESKQDITPELYGGPWDRGYPCTVRRFTESTVSKCKLWPDTYRLGLIPLPLPTIYRCDLNEISWISHLFGGQVLYFRPYPPIIHVIMQSCKLLAYSAATWFNSYLWMGYQKPFSWVKGCSRAAAVSCVPLMKWFLCWVSI